MRSLLTDPVVAALAATALAASALVALPAAADDAGGIAWTVQTVDNANGAGRANFTYDVAPGDTVKDAMRVTNTGTVALPLTAYVADAFTTPSGEIDILAAGEESTDAGLWIDVAESDLELKPGTTAEIAFTITVPGDARPGDHAAGLVTSYVSQDSSSTISVDRRLGSRINLRVAGELAPAARVGDVRTTYVAPWNPFASGTILLDYTLENTGNTRITARDALEASGPLGLLATDGASVQLPEVIPGSTIEVRRELPVTSLGWVSGSLVVAPEGIGLGAGSVARIVVPFDTVAVPWSLLAIVVLLLLAGLAVLLMLRRRARRGAVAAPTEAVTGE